MFFVAVARSSSGGVAILHTSGFVDDDMFYYNRPYGGVTLPQQLTDCSVVHADTPASGAGCVLSLTPAEAKTRRVL